MLSQTVTEATNNSVTARCPPVRTQAGLDTSPLLSSPHHHQKLSKHLTPHTLTMLQSYNHYNLNNHQLAHLQTCAL